MAALPYMQLYVADYMADTAHLSALEHGGYLLLIMTYWQRGKPLPDNDSKLARIARMSDKEWADVKPSIEEFFTVSNGMWSHKRIDAELQKVADKSLKARKAREQRTINERTTDVVTDVPTNVKRSNYHTDTDTEEETKGADAPPEDLDKILYDRGKTVLGQKAAGLITKLKTQVGTGQALEAVEQASRKNNPVEYIGGVLRNNAPKTSGPKASQAEMEDLSRGVA